MPGAYTNATHQNTMVRKGCHCTPPHPPAGSSARRPQSMPCQKPAATRMRKGRRLMALMAVTALPTTSRPALGGKRGMVEG